MNNNFEYIWGFDNTHMTKKVIGIRHKNNSKNPPRGDGDATPYYINLTFSEEVTLTEDNIPLKNNGEDPTFSVTLDTVPSETWSIEVTFIDGMKTDLCTNSDNHDGFCLGLSTFSDLLPKLVSIDKLTVPLSRNGKQFQAMQCSTITFNDSDNIPRILPQTSFYLMFNSAQEFNQDISNWNTTNVTNMQQMFSYAKEFDGDISKWDMTGVTDMNGMFRNATAFNQDISNWNTSAVNDMSNMFYYAEKFNQDIGNWITSKVTDMKFMFYYATAFNQNIGSWNTSKVTDMESMFRNASAFNQDLSEWDLSGVTNCSEFYSGDEDTWDEDYKPDTTGCT